MSAPTTYPDKPPLPVLTHVALPIALTCVVLAAYPPAPARAVTIVLLGAVFLYDASAHSAADRQAAYWIGASLGPSWFGFLDLLLLGRPVNEWRFRTLERPLGELSLLRRTYYVLCASMAARGVGWSYQIDRVPPVPRLTRAQFLWSRVKRVAWHAFLADVGGTYMTLNPLFADTERSLRSQGPVLAVLNVLMFSMTLSYCAMCIMYDVYGFVSVALRISDPPEWSVVFGKWREAYTVRRFWARTWHQNMRRYLSSIGKFVARTLGCPQGSWLSSHVQLFVGFIVSGLCHVGGDMMVGLEWTGLSFPFFLLQAVAITAEDAVIAAGKRFGVRDAPWLRVVGYVWTVAWFTWSTPLLSDWMRAAGAQAKPRLFPGSVIEPIVRYIASTVGYSLPV